MTTNETNAETEAAPQTEIVDGVEVTDETGHNEATKASKKKASRAKAASKKRTTTKAKTDTKPTKKVATKKTQPANDAPPATLTTKNLTLGQLPDAYGADLAERAKTEKTIASYQADLRVAAKYFGEDTKIAALTTKQIAEYFDSDAVCKNRQGKRRSEITIAKVRRTFRMALERLAEVGAIKNAPIPPKAEDDDAKG